jgi:hypothetical protein
MAALDFGLVLRAAARGGSLADVMAMNEKILAACVEHDLSARVVDHLQFDDAPLLECFALLAHAEWLPRAEAAAPGRPGQVLC